MRDIKDLESKALKFWPKKISVKEKNSSIIPKLIETQDKFISLLNISDASPFKWKDTLLSTKNLSGNLFLKHLICCCFSAVLQSMTIFQTKLSKNV